MKPIHHINRPKNENQLLFAVILTLPQRPLTSRTQRQTNIMPGTQYKKETHLKICLIMVLLIL